LTNVPYKANIIQITLLQMEKLKYLEELAYLHNWFACSQVWILPIRDWNTSSPTIPETQPWRLFGFYL